MSSEWQLASIDELKAPRNGSIAIGPFGSRMKSDCYVSDGVKVIRGTNLMGGRDLSGEFVFITEEKAAELGNSNVLENDLVFPHRGSIGEVGIVPNDGNKYVLSSSLMKLSCDTSKVNPLFIYYFFKSATGRFELLKNASQVGTPGIGQPLTSLKSIKLGIPRIETQKNIVDLLTSLDDRITLLRETNTTLEAIAQALFKSWFVDLDPVRAKQEGREPEGMDANTSALFPDSFEESELGLVPKGWKVDSIYSAAQLIYGAPFASSKFNSDSVGKPLIRIRDLKNEAPGVFTPEVHPKGYLVQPGDIVVGMDGEFRAYLWGGEEAWLNQRVCVFVPLAGFPATFVHLSIMPILAAVEASETATTVIHLGKNDIDRFRIIIPAEAVLKRFGEITDPIYKRVVEQKQKARTLATICDTLLPRLISGQLRLPDAEVLIEEAAA